MSTAAMVWIGYIVLLFIAAAVAILSRPMALSLAGLAVLYMWTFGQVAAQLGYETPAAVYFVMDSAACLGFWIFGRTRGARIFAATFAVQVALHVAYLAGAFEAWPYWWLHTASAYLQLFVLIGWAIGARKEKEA